MFFLFLETATQDYILSALCCSVSMEIFTTVDSLFDLKLDDIPYLECLSLQTARFYLGLTFMDVLRQTHTMFWR